MAGTQAVLFDLGNTLAAYYRRDEFRPILERAIGDTAQHLRAAGFATPPPDEAFARAVAENREADDFHCVPMIERLARIFGLPGRVSESFEESLCMVFLRPIFAVGRVYDDTTPSLTALRARGYRTAIVSNAPWGSSPKLWRRELGRLGVADLVDSVVLCGDVGWRKPAKQIFQHAADRLGVPCARCVFVGDDLQWDIAGSAAAGMRPVLCDRDDRHADYRGERVRGLGELVAALARLEGA